MNANPAVVSGSLQRHVLALRTQAGRCIICWLRSDEFASLACMLSGEQYTPVPSTFCAAHIRRQNPSNTRSQVPRALFSTIRAPPRCTQRARETRSERISNCQISIMRAPPRIVQLPAMNPQHRARLPDTKKKVNSRSESLLVVRMPSKIHETRQELSLKSIPPLASHFPQGRLVEELSLCVTSRVSAWSGAESPQEVPQASASCRFRRRPPRRQLGSQPSAAS